MPSDRDLSVPVSSAVPLSGLEGSGDAAALRLWRGFRGVNARGDCKSLLAAMTGG